MKYKVKVTVIDKKLYPELQEKYCADPDTVAGGPKMPHCSEAWDAIARYIYAGLQGGSGCIACHYYACLIWLYI